MVRTGRQQVLPTGAANKCCQDRKNKTERAKGGQRERGGEREKRESETYTRSANGGCTRHELGENKEKQQRGENGETRARRETDSEC